MKSYIGFAEADEENVRALRAVLEPQLDTVVDRFYETMLRHPGARGFLETNGTPTDRLRGHFRRWLALLFEGTYDEAYVVQRARVGQVHVAVDLPQHFMFCAMEVLWSELERIVRADDTLEHPDEKLASLHKLLTIETGLMLESYRASYTQQIRRLEYKAIEERLTRAEQLAEIGQLAASLAHEIKNPLAGISGAIQVIREDLPANDDHQPILSEILRQIRRVDGTVKDLLSYARPQQPAPKQCDLGAIVQRVVALLRQEPAFRDIRLEIQNGAAADLVADEHQLEQLLVNLLLNAAHASPAGKRVWVIVDGGDAELHVVVEDEGRGMDEESARRAFEPFYTTKSRGTGLGLPICQRIVETHGGTIQLESRAGGGTRVEIRLPRRRKRKGSG